MERKAGRREGGVRRRKERGKVLRLSRVTTEQEITSPSVQAYMVPAYDLLNHVHIITCTYMPFI